MSKSYKKNVITGMDQFQSVRRHWGDLKPGTRIERPKRGGGYKRKEKFGNKWDY